MSRSPQFLQEVEADAIAGFRWYEGKARGLGEEFLRTFYACAAHIAHNPRSYKKIHKNFRRALLRRFPYALYFTAEKDTIIIYGLFHCARNPITLKKVLGGRR